jgi:pyrimidine operon attenuation protein/uracil phosphoribosyltransferase
MAGEEVMSAVEVDRTIARLAHEIVERAGDPREYTLVGVITGGLPLAQRLADGIESAAGHRPGVGSVDITLYRDDLYTGLEKPVLGETRLPIDLAGQGIVLVDDVLFTGRTVRAALGEIMDYGRPRWIKLAVLVDRGHRELPIAPDFVGRSIATERADKVVVQLDGDRGVSVRRAGVGA